MTARTDAERKAAERARKAEKGIVRIEVAVPAGTEDEVRRLAQMLQRSGGGQPISECWDEVLAAHAEFARGQERIKKALSRMDLVLYQLGFSSSEP